MPISLVTGGAGFIGSHIVDLLIEKGHDVIIIDNLSTGDKANINSKAKFYEMDIINSGISSIFKKEKPGYVFHMAAQINLRMSVTDPMFDSETNILGALNILENSVKNGVKKIFFPSSGTIYGEAKILPTPEDYAPRPLSPYAINKLTIENYLFYYRSIISSPIDYVVLRLGNIYGPRQSTKGEAGVIAIFIDKLLNNVPPVIYGDGKQTRDYVYVKDVVHAFILALEKPISGHFNISTGKETNVNEIYVRLIKATHKIISPVYMAEKDGDQKRICLDRRKALEELEWTPQYDLNSGINETVEWFQQKFRAEQRREMKLLYYPDILRYIMMKRKNVKIS
jgi:UDP-glucose 4-epimerase